MNLPANPSGTLKNLAAFIGNGRVVNLLRRAIGQDRLPHALIFAGPSGVGKCTLAILLAQHLNCMAPDAEGACGECPSCRKTLAVLNSRHLECLALKGQARCGACANCKTLAGQHPDVRLVEPEKTTIGIDQVRDLITEISFQPFEGRYRVAIFDPADQMRQEAHNSLLKTLEEPPSRTILVLVTTKPFDLLTTIRSRCRMLQFVGIPQHQIEEYLVRCGGRAPAEARMAAALSRGSLTAALEFNGEIYQELREKALSFLSLLLSRGSFTQASAIAASVAKDKDKEHFLVWLECIEGLLQDVYFAQVSANRMIQSDLVGQLKTISSRSGREAVVASIEAVKRLRRSLQRNVQRQLAVEALFLSLSVENR